MYQQLLVIFTGLFCVQGLGVDPKALPWTALPSLGRAVALSLAPTDSKAIIPGGASSPSSAAPVAQAPRARAPFGIATEE